MGSGSGGAIVHRLPPDPGGSYNRIVIMNAAYEYRHIVALEETNLVGNVYYVNHLRWQGRCREMFLKEHAPEILDELSRGFSLVTVRCSCSYLNELFAFDEVAVRMRLKSQDQGRMTLSFEYWRIRHDGEELVGRGEQEIACMRRQKGEMMPTHVPDSLQRALRVYAQR
jgi:enediyne biosynthesis thioesterase